MISKVFYAKRISLIDQFLFIHFETRNLHCCKANQEILTLDEDGEALANPGIYQMENICNGFKYHYIKAPTLRSTNGPQFADTLKTGSF